MSQWLAGSDRSVLRADARERPIVFRVRKRIHAQNVNVRRELAAELLELNRLRRSARGPQASSTFPAKRDSGMCLSDGSGGRTRTVDRIMKSNGVGRDVSIKGQVGAAFDGAINVHTLRAQLLQKTSLVSLRRQSDRGIARLQGGGNKASKAVDDRGVIRTEENLVTMWSRSVGSRFGKLDAAAHESLATEYGVDRSQQVSRGRRLLDVPKAAQAQRRSYDVRRRLLADEEKFCVRDEPADLFSDFESMELRQVDIKENQIRLQLFRLLNGLQPIRRFVDLERPLLNRRTNKTAERGIVLDDENPQRQVAHVP